MWIRGKDLWPRWARWDWNPDLTPEVLVKTRDAVREEFQRYCLGKELVLVNDRPNIWTPLGFTPNDFVKAVVARVAPEVKVTIFNIRYFFQVIQVADGSYLEGPVEPFRRMNHCMRPG